MNATSEEEPHSPYFLIPENPTLFILTLGGIFFNFVSFCCNFSIVLIILKNVRSMWNRFYFFILFMCFWETMGRCQTAVFQTFRLHALCTDARALFMRRWTCLTFLGCAYISDTLFNVVLLVFAIERFRMQYDPLAYDTLVKRCTLFVATFVTVGAILYVVGPPVILHINEQGTIRCLSYYAPLQSFQTESFLIFSFVIRTMAILINLASIVHTKLTHNKKVFPINQSTNGTQKEATKIFIDYVKIVVWIETCFGMPYSILREITLSMNLSDFVFMHVLAISIFTDSVFGAVEPLVILLKNSRIREHLVSIFKRKNSRAAIFSIYR